jgi:hypothetical protein
MMDWRADGTIYWDRIGEYGWRLGGTDGFRTVHIYLHIMVNLQRGHIGDCIMEDESTRPMLLYGMRFTKVYEGL